MYSPFHTVFKIFWPKGLSRVAQSPVFLAKPDEVSCSEAMSRLRIWLDSRKIQPAGFKLAPNGASLSFEITFHSERDAALFGKEFGWELPGG